MLNYRIDSLVKPLYSKMKSPNSKKIYNSTKSTSCAKSIKMTSVSNNYQEKSPGYALKTTKSSHSWMKMPFYPESSETWKNSLLKAQQRWKGVKRNSFELAGKKICLRSGWESLGLRMRLFIGLRIREKNRLETGEKAISHKRPNSDLTRVKLLPIDHEFIFNFSLFHLIYCFK